MLWLNAYLFEFTSTHVLYKKFWFDAQFIGKSILPFVWLSMILVFYDFPKFAKPIRITGYFFTGVTLVLLIFANKNGLVYSDFHIETNQYFEYTSIVQGSWYYLINYLYLLVYFLIGIIIFKGVFNKTRNAKKLIYLFIYLISIVTIGGLLNYIPTMQIIPNMNHIFLLTPLMTIPIMIFTTQKDSLGTIPYSYRLIIDNLSDGIIIVNPKNEILTINKVAQSIFLEKSLSKILSQIQNNLVDQIEFNPDIKILLETNIPIRFKNDYTQEYYEFSLTKAIENKEFLGYILAFKNITHHFAAYQEMANIARTDSLTQTINRAYFEQSFAELIKSLSFGSSISIAVVDIDNFKKINDAYGHIIGDQILQLFARIVKENTRESDLIIRYGGDEFILVFSNIREVLIKDKFTRIQKEFNKEICKGDYKFKFVTFSYGIYTYTLENEKSLSCLNAAIDLADQVMYKNKRHKNRIVI